MNHKRGPPKGVAPIEAQRASRCTGHSSRTGLLCKNPTVRGTNVCMTHGGAAPQVPAKAALRQAMPLDPALQVYADILKDKDHPDAFRVAKDILDPNKQFDLGTPEDVKPPGHSLTVNTQINTN